MEEFVASWRRRLARIRDEATRLQPGTYLEVRYEHLIENPAEIMRSVGGFLGLDSAEPWLEACAERIRSRPAANTDDEIFKRLGPQDLEALNTEGDVDYLLLDADSDDAAVRKLVDHAQSRFGREEADDGIRAALSVIALDPWGTKRSETRRAMCLLVRCLRLCDDTEGALRWMKLGRDRFPLDPCFAVETENSAA